MNAIARSRSCPANTGSTAPMPLLKPCWPPREAGRGAGVVRRVRRDPQLRAGGKRQRRRRAKITNETRTQVKKLVEAGKTGAEIAKTVGISLPSVQNIKKALGLVQSRK